jgi:uncharacterized protein with PIN domain
MSLTIDGISVTVKRLSIDLEGNISKKDTWKDQAYREKLKQYGHIRTWTIDCFETAAWLDSICQSLEDIRRQLVTLVSTLPLHIETVTGRIENIATEYDDTGKLRYYTITFVEEP